MRSLFLKTLVLAGLCITTAFQSARAANTLTVTASPSQIAANGSSYSTLTISAHADTVPNPSYIVVTVAAAGPGIISHSVVNVVFSTGSLNGNGTSNSFLTSTTIPGTVMITATSPGFVAGTAQVITTGTPPPSCSGCQSWNGSACSDDNSKCAAGQTCTARNCITPPPPPPPNVLSIMATPSQIQANGTSVSTLKITANEGTYVSPVVVNLAATGPGKLTQSSVLLTVANGSLVGTVNASLTSMSSPGTVSVTASAQGFTSGSTQVVTVAPPPSQILLTASPTSMKADGRTKSVITIKVQEGRYASPVNVTLAISGPGTLSAKTVSIVVPAGSLTGSATVNLTSTKTTGVATVSATSSGFIAGTVSVTTTLR